MPKIYYVYILASQRRVLYIGMTSNIEHRVFQHKTHAFEGFSSKYNVTNLVYFERHGDVMTAIRREKEMKGGAQRRKDPPDRIDESEMERSKLRLVPAPPLPTRSPSSRVEPSAQ